MVINRSTLQAIQWANVVLLATQFLNNLTQVYPGLTSAPWVLIVQAFLAALLPSLGGLSHKVTGTEVVDKPAPPAGGSQ